MVNTEPDVRSKVHSACQGSPSFPSIQHARALEARARTVLIRVWGIASVARMGARAEKRDEGDLHVFHLFLRDVVPLYWLNYREPAT
jgi:hypothetical protein